MTARGWVVIGAPAPSRHDFRITMRLPWLVTALCTACGLFYSSGDARGLFFRRVKPTGFGVRDGARYVDTTEEPADCYAMKDERAPLEAPEAEWGEAAE